MPQFKSSRLKIERAEKHISDIEARIAILEDSDFAIIEINPQTGQKFVKHDLRDVKAIGDIALMIGDVVHNLKSSLDHAWFTILKRLAPSIIDNRTKFPVAPSAKDLENLLTNTKVRSASTDLYSFILDKVKPYDGGNDAIYPIHRLNICDKHRLLLPVVNYASINGLEMENERGQPEPGFVAGTWNPPPWYIHIPEGWHVKNKGKPTVSVLFDEGMPFYHFDVTDSLSMSSQIFLKVVELLENFLR